MLALLPPRRLALFADSAAVLDLSTGTTPVFWPFHLLFLDTFARLYMTVLYLPGHYPVLASQSFGHWRAQPHLTLPALSHPAL
ncbi:hypothetical protein K523DRAFT_97456 [Schizophyllum commune Tattone D]|nr:hypothetical protein K523DRAFT_97456 [Schizophyllum commune Tattone D]